MSDPTKRGVRLTIVGVLLFMTVVVASFIHRIGEPRVMSVAETRANGLFLFDTPRERWATFRWLIITPSLSPKLP